MKPFLAATLSFASHTVLLLAPLIPQGIARAAAETWRISNEVIRHVTRHDVVPILSSRDGRHAVAFFTPQRENFWAYYTHDVPSKNPTNACGKMTAFFKHSAAAGETYSYRTFIVVGNIATVQTSLHKLFTHVTTTPPPQNKP